MKYTLTALLVLSCGCASFTTTQTDISPERTITTKASAWTIFEASSTLANFKATQTDKSQSASVGSLNQESHTMTNVVELANKIVEGAVAGAVKAAKGSP